MRAEEFVNNRVMAKIERTGQIVQILRHEDHVKFSEDRGWFLINTEPGRRTGTSIKWIPDSTRFAWVKNFESLKESPARIPPAIEEFLDSLNPDDCGVEDIGAYRIHFEGFTSDCKSSADYRRDPEAVYQQVYRDFIQREGGQRPLVQDMVGNEDFPILYSIFRRKRKVAENPQRGRPPIWTKNLQSAKILQKELIALAKKIRSLKATEKEFDTYLSKLRALDELGYALGDGGILVIDPDNYYAPPAGTNINENTQATARQVLSYINKTHHEPFRPGEKMHAAVMAHPRWELKRVPLLNLNIPDEEYDDVDYDEYEPEADPYGRVMMVEPEHAGEVSQHLVDQNPIVIDADRYIIDGNHRAWAAKYLLNRQYINAWVPVEQIREDQEEYLYHATYGPLLKSIRAKGLGNTTQSQWTDSQPGVVYLARDPEVARSYAETAESVPEAWLDQIVVLQINKSKLNPKLLHRDRNVQDNTGDTLEYHAVIPAKLLRRIT